jgi:radial spoke head protein 4A
LAADSGAGRLRFFGKIRDTENDYYIAEGELEGGGEEEGEEGVEKPADFEPNGTGVNKCTYWVSHSSFGKWTKLPDLSPKDIRASRDIKVLFTGNLERTIHTNPFFFGLEKNYLRAQIARISHATSLAPSGLFRFVEESTRDVEDNVPDEGDIVLPSTLEMSSPSRWVHHSVSILNNCRTTHMEQEPIEGDEREPEEIAKEIESRDPFEPRLK